MINIDSQQKFSDESLLERAARVTLEISTPLLADLEAAPVDCDMTIVLTDDAQLHELNREFLGVDAPTDVLSFPSSESDPETGVPYLGDILISIPRATQQAQAGGHSVEAEAQLLVIHGTLHLLGHDHAEAEEKARMWKAQAEVLERLGLSHVKIQDS
ncbi:MAG: rRNA maturation RNase YbeY [Anaerolineales bacterium]|nr:rRNA maturation RNase YbeY [Anaerolineales bacterium]